MKIKAYAKLNLGLNIIAKRGDGFHAIETLFAKIDLYDHLTLAPQKSGIHLEVTGADLAADSSNLAYKAAQAYLELLPEEKGIAINLEKHIPIAAGLGGGSSDAAAVLKGLEKLYPADIDCFSLAKRLGSDIPFFLSGHPAALGSGRGEKLKPLSLPKLHVVLLNQGLAVKAADAYDWLQNFSARLKAEHIVERLASGEAPGYVNALQPGVFLQVPKLREAMNILRKAGLQGVLMSGSGATCFGLAKSKETAQKLAAEIQAHHPEYWVLAASSV